MENPQHLFSGSALDTKQKLRTTKHPEFTFREPGGQYPDANDSIHIYRLGTAGIMKLIVEILDDVVDNTMINTYARKIDVAQDSANMAKLWSSSTKEATTTL